MDFSITKEEYGEASRKCVPTKILTELAHLDLSESLSFTGHRVVGTGAYGDILKAKCALRTRGNVSYRIVAVKRLRFYLPGDIETLFTKEIYVWSKLNHENVLKLLGYAFDKSSGFPLLVSEWMSNGSSWNFVKQNHGCELMRLIIGIATGLSYLHQNGVVHSDIKPDNIVVSSSGDARICDFGGSRIADASRSIANPSTGIRGTQRYISYELVAFPDTYRSHTQESDVWAFGMTIFALLTQQQPYSWITREVLVIRAIEERKLPSLEFFSSISLKEKEVICNICSLCWIYEPRNRIDMASVEARLRDHVIEQAQKELPLISGCKSTTRQFNIDLPMPSENIAHSTPEASSGAVIQPAPRFSGTPEIHPMLSRSSPNLVRFDLRGTIVNVRKLIGGKHWTPLKADDHIIPACEPHRTHMTIYVLEPRCEDWVIDVTPRPHINSGVEYVTIGDVLNAISIKYNKPIDNKRWARDSISPEFLESIAQACKCRLETIDSRRRNEKGRNGVLRCDYLGPKYFFAGIQYADDGLDWFLMWLEREQRE